ncbi:MAG: thiolase family protein [Oscillospiraceae bacterium]|nr:thiolase family protein [Oscillospiraceae bacterium]
MQTEEVVVVSGARTPIGDYQGALKSCMPVELAYVAAKEAIERSRIDPEHFQEVVLGMLYKQGSKGNPARQIQLKCGMPTGGWAHTVDQQCASGMRAFENIVSSIQLGKTSVGLAVGVESMSNAPYLLMKARGGYRMGDDTVIDSMLYDGLVCAMVGKHMGVTAENLAEIYNISRQAQDELAVLSHQRAAAAVEKGVFDEEIVPVTVKSKKWDIVVSKDEHPRKDISMEKLSSLRPAFKEGGTVTAGNASSVNDGAAALVLASATTAQKLGKKPLARVLAVANAGVDPAIMGIGPTFAIPKSLEMAGLTLRDIGYFEVNEAFAAQFIACQRELNLDMSKVNLNGSGIGLGHPVGCTGARILVSLMYQMRRMGVRYGVASLCVGGGPAMSTVLELLE